jgi:hypothetical protein
MSQYNIISEKCAISHNMKNVNSDFEFFESQLPNLLKEHRGQFVLIKDKAIQGYYASVEQALKEGYDKFGNTDFLIQEITNEKRVNYINSAFI